MRKWVREGEACEARPKKLPLWEAGAQTLQATVGSGTEPASLFTLLRGEEAELCY